MTAGNQLFKLILDGEFYRNNKNRITKELFPDPLQPFVSLVIEKHKETETPQVFTISDILALYAALNPTLTKSKKTEIAKLFLEMDAEETLTSTVAEEVLRQVWKEYLCRLIANESLKIAENKSEDWNRVSELIEQAKSGYLKQEENKYIVPDLDALLDFEERNYKWRWNVEELNEKLCGLGPQMLVVLAARPNIGKTLSWVHFTFGPGGWLDQGAKVHVLCNEEPAFKTFLRGVCSKVGFSLNKIRENTGLYSEQTKSLEGKIFIQDISTYTIDDLEAYCENKEIDILIIDQLDKLSGITAGNTAEVLQKLYERTRLLCKKHNLAVVAVNQAGASAQDKLYFGYEGLNNSKTGKAGEADIILCIGAMPRKENGEDDGFRVINIAKHKHSIEGTKTVPCFFNSKISRIEDARNAASTQGES